MKKRNQSLKKAIPWLMTGTLALSACLLGACGKEPENKSAVESIKLSELQETTSMEGDADVEGLAEDTESSTGSTAAHSPEPSEESAVAASESEPEEEVPVHLESFLLYFSGIDVWGWVDTQSRSDVNIIAAVNPATRHIQLINTPRDYYVEMPVSDGLKDKLTHAGLYGVENSVGTLETLYGIEIDYYIRMNFSGFEAIIDTLGGVDVYSEHDFTVDPIKHYTEGYNHLTGLEALAFVRERHAFADGDNQRGRNQMALVQAMVKKVCSLDFLLNYAEVMEELADMFRTDVPLDLIAAMVGNQLLDDTEWTVDTYSVSGSNGSERTYSVPGAESYVMLPDEDAVAEAKKLIEEALQGSN